MVGDTYVYEILKMLDEEYRVSSEELNCYEILIKEY